MQRQIGDLQQKHDRFEDLLNNTDTSDSPEFKSLSRSLANGLRDIDKNVSMAKQSIEFVMKDRSKFPLITDSDLESRSASVREWKMNITSIRSGIESERVRRKIRDDEERAKQAALDDTDDSTPIQQRENSRFLKGQLSETRYMLEEQDNAIESLNTAADRLGVLSKDIHVELKEQNVMLDEMDEDIENAADKMAGVQQVLGKKYASFFFITLSL